MQSGFEKNHLEKKRKSLVTINDCGGERERERERERVEWERKQGRRNGCFMRGVITD